MKRDRNRCVLCNETENLCVHHKDRNRENNKPFNLITLCRDCHYIVHGKKSMVPYKEDIIRLKRKGLSQGEIADRLGIEKGQVGGVIANAYKKDPTISEDSWKNSQLRWKLQEQLDQLTAS